MHPPARRPYQVPLPTWACALMLLPAMGLLVTIIAIPFYTLQWKVRPALQPSTANSSLTIASYIGLSAIVPASCFLYLQLPADQQIFKTAECPRCTICSSWRSLLTGRWLLQTMAWTLGAMIVGSALHPLMQAARRNDWCAACKQAQLALISFCQITLPSTLCCCWSCNNGIAHDRA